MAAPPNPGRPPAPAARTSTQRPVTEQCLARSGLTILQLTHSWFQLPAQSAGESSDLHSGRSAVAAVGWGAVHCRSRHRIAKLCAPPSHAWELACLWDPLGCQTAPHPPR